MVINAIEDTTNNVKEDGHGIQVEGIVHLLIHVELINNGMVSDADVNKVSTTSLVYAKHAQMEQYLMVINVHLVNLHNTAVIHIHSGMDIVVYVYLDIGH